MEQMNKVELRGTIGSFRQQKINEKTVVNFTLVTSYAFKDKDGVAVIEDTWHNVTAWEGKGVKDIGKLEKGAKVSVEGRIRSRSYTSADGTDRQIYEIVASRISVLDENEPLQYEM